jgi:SAM-dependent methyltransferase
MKEVDKAKWLREIVLGKTFADIGGLWGTKNEMVSTALKAGCGKATMVDIAPLDNSMWTDLEQHLTQLGCTDYSKIQADAAAPDLAATIGQFDVVHCSGVLYHLPDPHALLRNLHSVTKDWLILTSMTVPEVISNEVGTIDLSGGGAWYMPALDDRRIEIMRSYFAGVGIAFETVVSGSEFVPQLPDGTFNYAPWWWFFTPRVVGAMLSACNFHVENMGQTWSAGATSFLCTRRHA